jgi:hypothetical protein
MKWYVAHHTSSFIFATSTGFVQTPRGGLHFCDSSKIAEEDDNKVVERCQNDTDGILIRESLRPYSYPYMHKLVLYRPDYFLPSSLRYVVIISVKQSPQPQWNSEFHLKNTYRFLSH